MPMTVVVVRDVPDRFRGFLASVMLEIAPCVYTGPKMTAGIRERVWKVLEEWYQECLEGGVLMTWPDTKQPGGQAIRTLGWTRRELIEIDGIILSRVRSVTKEQEEVPF